MSVRTSIHTSAEASPSSTPASATGRTFIPGRAGRGPLEPTVITGPAEFVARYGPRSDLNRVLYDNVMAHFATGGAVVIVIRATGPAAAKARLDLVGGANTVTVTAKEVGGWGNGLTAKWDATTKTLTITAPDGTVEPYVCTDLADLLAKTAVSALVDVTSASAGLPTGAIGPTALAGGSDDYAAADLATLMAKVPATWGPGAVFVPGVAWSEKLAGSADTVATVLGAHCAAVEGIRTALVSSPASVTTAALWETDKKTLAAVPNAQFLAPVWPAPTLTMTVGTASVTTTVDPCSVAAGRRSAAHGINPEVSPLREDLRVIPAVSDVAVNVTDAEALTAFGTGGVLLRKETGPDGSTVVIASWKTAAAPAGDIKRNLHGLQHRDLTASICWDLKRVGASKEGVTIDGKGEATGDLASRMSAVLEPYATRGALFVKRNADGTTAPAYRVDTSSAVNTTDSLAAGRLRGTARVCQSPVAEYVLIDIVAGDADMVL